MKKNDSEILLVIDQKTIDKYADYYFKNHPRAKKTPIETPWHPSSNFWMRLKRLSMNTLKQKWKDFITWFIQDLKLENYNILNCEILFTYYFYRNSRHDPDNYSPKFLLDGLTEVNFLVDDSNNNIEKLSLRCKYDKENPRTEIYIYNIKRGEKNGE